MHVSRAILVIWLAAAVGGCSWMKERWPWRKQQVPVTEASEQARLSAPPPAAETQPAEPEPNQAAVAVAPSDLQQPTRLTDLLPETSPAVQPPPVRPPEPTSAPAAEPNRTILARPEVVASDGLQVNNTYVTIEDILAAAAGRLSELPRNLTESAFGRQAGEIISSEIRNQMRNALVYPEAQSRMQDKQKSYVDEEISKTLRQMIAEAGGSRRKLEQIWIERGTTLERVLDEHRRTLIVNLYLQARFVPSIVITRKMLYDYYRKHRDTEYTLPKKVQMQIIAAPSTAFLTSRQPTEMERRRAKATARQAIAEADKAIRAGRGFAEVVKIFSKGPKAEAGGLWPLMGAGNYKEAAVEAAAFVLREGQVSDIIETDSGYYMVKAAKVEPGRVLSFMEAQEEIEDLLTRRQYESLQERYLLAKTQGASIVPSKRLEEIALQKAMNRYWRK
ncbi:MAG TPA: peptidyl-prolyl cis-trans isomerase [Phycisphaerae bacterium]|nr:peptidyl-prolyl cis-trans isomerase [Phycisphaerae bacterium]